MMPTNSIVDLYKRLKARQTSDGKELPVQNEFYAVSEAEVKQLEGDLGFSLPAQLRNFYINVGSGFLNVDALGQHQNDYPNNIIDLDRMRLFWRREEVSFEYDHEIVAPDELVFFDMGSYMYLVVRPFSDQPNAVYYPRDQKPVAADFNDFVFKLYQNTTFYLDHESVFED